MNERLGLVQALLDAGADPNPRMTASEMPGLGFLRNGSYDNFGTGTGDVAGATPVMGRGVRYQSRPRQRVEPVPQYQADVER